MGSADVSDTMPQHSSYARKLQHLHPPALRRGVACLRVCLLAPAPSAPAYLGANVIGRLTHTAVGSGPFSAGRKR